MRLLDTPSDNPIDAKRAIGAGTRGGSLARMIAEAIRLWLETRKGPVEIVVPDHAERTPLKNQSAKTNAVGTKYRDRDKDIVGRSVD